MMNIKSKITLIAFGIGFFCASYAQDVRLFNGSYNDLKKMSEQSKLPYLIDFYTDWCGFCKKMDATTFRDSSVVSLLNSSFIVYKINAEQGEGPAIAQQFGVKGYPTMVLLSSQHKLLKAFGGYVTPSQLMPVLQEFAPSKEVVAANEKRGESDKLVTDYFRNRQDVVWKQLLLTFTAEEQQAIQLVQQFAVKNDVFEYDELILDWEGKDVKFSKVLMFIYASQKLHNTADLKKAMGQVLLAYQDSKTITNWYVYAALLHLNYLDVAEEQLRWVNLAYAQTQKYDDLLLKIVLLDKLGLDKDVTDNWNLANKMADKQGLDKKVLESLK